MEKMRPTTDFGVLSPYLWRYGVLMEFSLKTRVLIGYFEVTWHIFIIHLKYFAVSDWLQSLFISSQAFIQYPSLLSAFHSFFLITSSDFSRTMFDERTDQWLIQGKGPETRSPPYFWTKLRLEGRKMFLRRPALPVIYGSGWPCAPPPPSQGLDPVLQIMTMMWWRRNLFFSFLQALSKRWWMSKLSLSSEIVKNKLTAIFHVTLKWNHSPAARGSTWVLNILNISMVDESTDLGNPIFHLLIE